MAEGQHRALMDPKNMKSTATLTPRAWHLMGVQATKQELLAIRFGVLRDADGKIIPSTYRDRVLDYLRRKYPGTSLVDNQLETSSAMEGKKLDRVADVMIGAREKAESLQVHFENNSGAPSGEAGHAAAARPTRPRGFRRA